MEPKGRILWGVLLGWIFPEGELEGKKMEVVQETLIGSGEVREGKETNLIKQIASVCSGTHSAGQVWRQCRNSSDYPT